MAQDDEERRVQVHGGVLQGSHDFGGDHIARHAHDEELAEGSVEHELGRHARVAAADDGGVGFLLFRQRGEDFLSDGREARPAGDEAPVSRDQPGKRFVRRVLLSPC